MPLNTIALTTGPKRNAYSRPAAQRAAESHGSAAKNKKIVKFDPNVLFSRLGAGRGWKRHYDANDIIFSQGEPANAIYYLQEGKAKVTVASKGRKEAVLAILGPGDFYGEGCMNGQSRRTATVKATTECTTIRLDKGTMVRILHDEPDFAELFMAHLLHRNNRVEGDLVHQLFNSTEKRLARTLLLMANFGKERKREPVIGKFSNEKLAEIVGTTRTRVGLFMDKFRRLGFIEYADSGLHVHTSLLNMLLHDGLANEHRKNLSK